MFHNIYYANYSNMRFYQATFQFAPDRTAIHIPIVLF